MALTNSSKSPIEVNLNKIDKQSRVMDWADGTLRRRAVDVLNQVARMPDLSDIGIEQDNFAQWADTLYGPEDHRSEKRERLICLLHQAFVDAFPEAGFTVMDRSALRKTTIALVEELRVEEAERQLRTTFRPGDRKSVRSGQKLEAMARYAALTLDHLYWLKLSETPELSKGPDTSTGDSGY